MADTATRFDDRQFYDDPVPARPTSTPKAAKAKPTKRPYCPPDQRCAARLEEWCEAYDVPLGTMHRWKVKGLAPKITRRGRLKFVTRDDWHAWWKLDIPPDTDRGKRDRARRAAGAATRNSPVQV
jgi:hypothetical protein